MEEQNTENWNIAIISALLVIILHLEFITFPILKIIVYIISLGSLILIIL